MRTHFAVQRCEWQCTCVLPQACGGPLQRRGRIGRVGQGPQGCGSPAARAACIGATTAEQRVLRPIDRMRWSRGIEHGKEAPCSTTVPPCTAPGASLFC